MRSKRNLRVALIAMLWSCCLYAAIPNDKRTILTSGEKVFTIHYQIGQSTVLYFGLKPEIVICGNKNYFNIEKIKDGITIQPLSNFSTNLTVMIQSRRYLFYLTPAGSGRPDGFVEVKWVPSSEAKPVKAGKSTEVVREIGEKVKLSQDLVLTVLREITSAKGDRRIFELGLKNLGAQEMRTDSLEVVAAVGATPIERQVLVWEDDKLKAKKELNGRLIVTAKPGNLNVTIGYRGKNTRVVLRGNRH